MPAEAEKPEAEVPALTVEAVTAEAARLEIPADKALGWFNDRGHPDHKYSLTRKLDWRVDMVIWWNKCGAAAQKKDGDVAESSAPANGTSGKPMSPAMKRMSVEGALKRLKERLENHPGKSAIATAAEKQALGEMVRMRKKLEAEQAALDLELVAA